MKNSQRTLMTKRRIGAAYLELRHRYPIERIRITELCRAANSNRTTFYHYFEDVYNLNEEVENAILEECFANFQYQGLIYTDPERYLKEFDKALTPRKNDLHCLGKNREVEQYAKLEKWLVKLARKDDSDKEEELLLTFVIGGIGQVISYNRSANVFTEDEVTRMLNRIVTDCLGTAAE